MPGEVHQLLLVEDNPADVALTQAILEEADDQFDVMTAQSLAEAWAILARRAVDAVLLDLYLPDSAGPQTVATMRARYPKLPIVVMSGANLPELRRGALSSGASDFIWKNEPGRGVVARCVRHAIERARAEETERHTRLLIDANPDAVLVVGATGVVRHVNAAARRMFAGATDELVGEWFGFFACSEGGSEIQVIGHARPLIGEMRVADIEWRGEPATLASIRDVTETRNLEERLREAQKLEAVGLLAGGLAHDFNNLLVVIMGNVEFLLMQLDDADPRRAMVEKIQLASDRARQLTSQLLTFARRQPTKPAVVDANQAVLQLHGLLRRGVPSTVGLRALPAPTPWCVRIDPNEFDQALLNLSFNARQAMPAGGTCDIVVTNHVLTRPLGRLAPGEYVRIDVSDSGSGIAPENLERIFEPFFTTKASGTGTGLGLAICREIARKAGGEILVASVVGKGSTFSVYLPRSEEAAADAAAPTRAGRRSANGSGTILVVDDDPGVAAAVRDTLVADGFSVVLASDGEAAQAAITAADRPFDLVVTDAVMPRLGGSALAAWLAAEEPHTKLLMMTGYTDEVDAIAAQACATRGLILKPFTPTQLLAAVWDMLSGARTVTPVS